MPTPALIPRSPFVPRTAQPPHSHVENSTRAELDQLGLRARRAMVDVEPDGSSDLGGDPSDDEPPSLTSASPSEDDDPEDPENPSGKKKKKKRKTKRQERRRSKAAKAIATSKIVVNLLEFTGKDASEFAENYGRFLRMTGQTWASGRVKCDGDTLYRRKAPHIWLWAHFALAKSPSYTAMGTLCTAKKPLICGDGDTLHCQRAPHIWRWGHLALPKSPAYTVMATPCTSKNPLLYGDGDTSSFVCPVRCVYWGLTSMYTSRRTDRPPTHRFVPLKPCRGRRSR